ncbi:unnamed protein product [Closterium sp. Yama58-4]|nr:unnamed protein product [Closterium sp. Yama58-4]
MVVVCESCIAATSHLRPMMAATKAAITLRVQPNQLHRTIAARPLSSGSPLKSLPHRRSVTFRPNQSRIAAVRADSTAPVDTANESSPSPSASAPPSSVAASVPGIGGVAVVTDATVPEGHRGLHDFLYGEGDVHEAATSAYTVRPGEDDGALLSAVQDYVAARELQKLAGIYAVYDGAGALQYVGYSRNIVVSLKGHRAAMGEELCSSVRVQVYRAVSMLSRAVLDGERRRWLQELGGGWRAGRRTGRATDAGCSCCRPQKATTGALPFARPGASATGAGGGVEEAEGEMDLTVESADRVLDRVRPYLVADGGNVEVKAVENGVVILQLQGACNTCPSSAATMKMGIERALQDAFGEKLKEVMQLGGVDNRLTLAAVENHLSQVLQPTLSKYGASASAVSLDLVKGFCEVRFEGPPPMAMGIQAALKDKFPEIRLVKLVS